MKYILVLLVGFGLGFATAFHWEKICMLRDAAPATTSSSGQQSSNQVILYATEWCGYCRKARTFFKENNIAYVEHDIEKSAEAKAQYDQLNGNGVPLIVINDELFHGFDPSELKEALKL